MHDRTGGCARGAKRFAMSAVCGLALAISASAMVRAETLKLLGSWSENDKPAYANGLLFKNNVEAVSGGKTKVEISGPGAMRDFG